MPGGLTTLEFLDVGDEAPLLDFSSFLIFILFLNFLAFFALFFCVFVFVFFLPLSLFVEQTHSRKKLSLVLL